MTKKEQRAKTVLIRERYSCYKVADLAVRLFLNNVSEEDTSYIMRGGEEIKMKPYKDLELWLAGAMDRLAERLPEAEAVALRQESACCLSGVRDKLAKEICKSNDSIDARFEALSHERKIIGGKAWREGKDFFVSYWYEKPATGYTCACIRHVPETEPMNKLWCECCAGHIKHHFETALGVKAVCRCQSSVLSSCGKDACVFKLNIVSGT